MTVKESHKDLLVSSFSGGVRVEQPKDGLFGKEGRGVLPPRGTARHLSLRGIGLLSKLTVIP